MTDCRRELTFSFYQHKQLVADFKSGEISSDTGLLAVRELDAKLGWLAQAASLISDPRRPDRTELDVLALLRQRVFGLIGGYEDQNDHDRLRTDPVLKLTCDRSPQDGPLASQPTLSRFENWPTARQVTRLNRLLVEHYIALHRHQRFSRLRRPAEMILDVDPTDDPCHGAQQLALFNGFYDQYPAFVAEGRKRLSARPVCPRLQPPAAFRLQALRHGLGERLDRDGQDAALEDRRAAGRERAARLGPHRQRLSIA